MRLKRANFKSQPLKIEHYGSILLLFSNPFFDTESINFRFSMCRSFRFCADSVCFRFCVGGGWAVTEGGGGGGVQRWVKEGTAPLTP